VRELTRYRKTQVDSRTREIQRLGKVLQDTGSRLFGQATPGPDNDPTPAPTLTTGGRLKTRGLTVLNELFDTGSTRAVVGGERFQGVSAALMKPLQFGERGWCGNVRDALQLRPSDRQPFDVAAYSIDLIGSCRFREL
jgi:hypothetical protein